MAKRKRNSDEFLSDFFTSKPKRAPLKKDSVRHDKFDRKSYDNMLQEMAEMSKSEDQCVENIKTGGPLFSDMYMSLLKATPDQHSEKEMEPNHLINHGVIGEMMDLKEYDELRMYTPGDEVATALACVSMEPELEILYDKLKHQQDLAEQLAEQMKQMQALQQQHVDIDELEQRWREGDPEAGKGIPRDGQGNPDFQGQKQLIEAQMQALQEAIDQKQAEFEEAMQNAKPAIQNSMRNAMREASEAQEGMENAAQLWGLEPGAIVRLPASERIELSRRLRNEKFKRLADLFGPMKNIAFTEQTRKVDYARDEVYDISLGNDLGRVLPTEFLSIRHRLMKLDFFRRYLEGELLQYELRGKENVGKGGIICCLDNSGSMSGEPEIWSKAFGLALLHIARKQHRSFHGVHFGSSYELASYDFAKDGEMDMQKVIDFAEFFFGGGTDFMRPLSHSLDLLEAEYASTGATKADIVFVTDGICGVHDDWLKKFKERQEVLNFRVYGVLIGGYYHNDGTIPEPLNTICDGRVVTIQQVLNGEELREIFRSI